MTKMAQSMAIYIIIIIIKGFIKLKGKTIYNIALTVVSTVQWCKAGPLSIILLEQVHNNYCSSFNNFVRYAIGDFMYLAVLACTGSSFVFFVLVL